MVVALKDLLSGKKTSISIDYTFSPEEAEAKREQVAFYEAPHVEGQILVLEEGCFFRGRIQADVRGSCAACLEDVHIPVTMEAEVCIVTSPSVLVVEHDTFVARDGQVDINELCLVQIANEIPLRVLCKEDCLGLCPFCGSPMEREGCSCCKEEQEMDQRLAKLKEFLSSM